MRINITARHFKASDKLKQFIDNEINKLTKYYKGIIDCEVILSYIKNEQSAEIFLNVRGQTLTTTVSSDDMFRSIDSAVKKLERQLRKYKTKMKHFSHEKAIDFVGGDQYEEE
ncbi:MAG: ribosome-associated translation inhibitor RaiA [bacterium]|nr:ribosome-associated translation inhibitor RaiA [bacterium]